MAQNTECIRSDVLVVGGGFAGTAAAIAAARQGASVTLLERSGFLGGAAGNNLIFPYMVFWTVAEGSRYDLSRGIFAEINRELDKLDALNINRFHEEYLKVVLERMALDAGVKLVYHTAVCGAQLDGSGRSITAVEGLCCGRLRRYEAACFIDATGDAELAVLAGVTCLQGRDADGLCQPMTLCFRMAGVDKEAFYRDRALIQPLYEQWQADGRISDPRENMLIFDYPIDGILHFNTTRVIRLDPTDPDDLTRAEIAARQQVQELVVFLKENFAAFANASLTSSAPAIGVRESRRIPGRHLLTVEELKDCTKFADAIAAGNYDVDIHDPNGAGTSHYYFEEGTWYTIPYRSLVAADRDNLLMAGRCVSATHEAQASIRIMPICCCMGEAAGTAAAMAAAAGIPAADVDTDALRTALTEAGAFCG